MEDFYSICESIAFKAKSHAYFMARKGIIWFVDIQEIIWRWRWCVGWLKTRIFDCSLFPVPAISKAPQRTDAM